MKKLLIGFVAFLLMVGIAGAADVTFRWQPQSESGMTSYKLYRSSTSGQYTRAQVVGEGNLVAIIPVDLTATPPINPSEFTLTGVEDGTHFFVLTVAGLVRPESAFSNEVSEVVNSAPFDPPQGLTIWQIIVAFFKHIWSLFA